MKSVAHSFVATAAIQLLNLVSGVLAARFLLPEGRGELAVILLWPGMIGALVYMSVDQAVAFYGAARSHAARRFCVLAMFATAPLALLAIISGYFILPHLVRGYDADTLALSRLYLLSIPFSYAAMTILAVFQGRQSFLAWNAVRLIPSLGYVVAILLFVVFGATSVFTFTVSSLGASVVTTLAAVVLLIRISDCPWRPQVGDLNLLLKYSVGVHLPVVASIANRQLDRALVAFLLAPDVLGIYVVALSASGLVRMVGGTVGPIAFARVAGQQDKAEKLRRFGRYFRLTLAISGLAALFFCLAGRWLIDLVFGQSFSLAADLLPLLLLGSFAHTMKHSLYFGLKAYAKLRAISIGEYVSFFIQTALLLVLLPQMGVMGAAWSVAISGVVGLVIAAAAMTTVTKVNIVTLALPTPDDFGYVLRKVVVGCRSLANP